MDLIEVGSLEDLIPLTIALAEITGLALGAYCINKYVIERMYKKE